MKVLAPSRIVDPASILFLSPGLRARKALAIDLTRVEWISPLGVVSILSVALCASARGLSVSVVAPRNQAARTYLDRIGFWAELRHQGWQAPGEMALAEEYEVQACIPVTPLTSEADLDRAAAALQAALDGSVAAPVSERVWTVAVELTQNAREHGSTCYMVVQTNTGSTSGTPGLHLAVADFGRGFAATLRAVRGPLGDAEAIVTAFEERVSGTGLPDRGFGLGFVADEIDAHPGAVLTIMSRSAVYRRTAGSYQTETGEVDFPGTLAQAYFPYSRPEVKQ